MATKCDFLFEINEFQSKLQTNCKQEFDSIDIFNQAKSKNQLSRLKDQAKSEKNAGTRLVTSQTSVKSKQLCCPELERCDPTERRSWRLSNQSKTSKYFPKLNWGSSRTFYRYEYIGCPDPVYLQVRPVFRPFSQAPVFC